MSKVIATVVGTIYDYTSIYPDRLIYFKGSSLTRTHMYGKIIFDYHDELVKDFYIFGIKNEVVGDISTYSKEERDNYEAFVVKRR